MRKLTAPEDPMRLAAALLLLIFALMATTATGTIAARSEMLSPVQSQGTAPN